MSQNIDKYTRILSSLTSSQSSFKNYEGIEANLKAFAVEAWAMTSSNSSIVSGIVSLSICSSITFGVAIVENVCAFVVSLEFHRC